jgi:hypothetical protein
MLRRYVKRRAATVALACACLAGAVAHAAPDRARPIAPPGSSALSNQVCLGCHGDAHLETTAPRGGVVSRYVDDPLRRSSVHADLACVDCHAGVTALPHRGAIPRVDCSRCHYVESLPSPLDRLGTTLSLSNGSPSQGARAPVGLHQRLRERGVKAAPACTNCHGAHDISPTRDSHSRVGRQGIAETCSACHPRTAADYLQSIHGQALREGNRDVPVCSDCHPEHPRDTKRRLPGIARAGVVAICTTCHEAMAPSGHDAKDWLPQGHFVVGSDQPDLCALCHCADSCQACHAKRGVGQ